MKKYIRVQEIYPAYTLEDEDDGSGKPRVEFTEEQGEKIIRLQQKWEIVQEILALLLEHAEEDDDETL